jgi:hypothetical protein
MSEAELVFREKKKKRIKQLNGETREEETNEKYSTQDEQPAKRIVAKGMYFTLQDVELKKAEDEARLQEKVVNQKIRETEEKFFTARNALTDSELGNVAKVVLSDQTIAHAKGKDTQRHHKKILGGLYHRDEEHTTEVEFHRSDQQ